MSQHSNTFDKKYFDDLYPEADTIDGDYNSKDHAKYLSSLFRLMGIHGSRIYDFGFGKGTLLKDIAKNLEATHIAGCDVSVYAFNKLKQKQWAHDWKLKVSDIHSLKIPKRPYDLGLCNSVLQYIPDKHLEKSIAVMASSCKYLYLHVPSKEDYIILKRDLSFSDPYAIQRSDRHYKKLLSKYFHFVSWGLLESKNFHSHSSSPFSDSLYRF